MKILKKTFAYVLPALMVAGGASSCTDFIEIDPENKVPEEEVDFSATSEMYKPVVGVYNEVRASAMHYINALLMFTRDGDVWSGRYDDQGPAATFSREFVYDNSYWGLNQVWINWYNIIRISNSALTSLDGYAQYLSEGSADYATYQSYCGEVRTMRAWAYYNLVTNFGPVPIYSDNLQTEFRRATIESVYNYMLEDLNYAMQHMQHMRPNEMAYPGAITVYTAEMLAAKIYMLMGNWEQVETLTDDIINNGNFSLYDDYYQLFKIPGKLCDESLFECQVTDFGNGSGDEITVDQFFNCQGPNGNYAWIDEKGESQSKAGITDKTNAISGWGFIGYEPEFVAWAEARGETVRATTSFLKAGSTTPEGWFIGTSSATTTDCWNGKSYLPYDQMTPGRTTYGSNNNVRIFRYADVLLMNAEAKVRNGGNGDAPFNEVRRRAQMEELTNVTLDQVLDERRMELCSEWGYVYQDLVRTGRAATVLGPKGWTEDKTYWPVPATQLENLPDLLLEPVEYNAASVSE